MISACWRGMTDSRFIFSSFVRCKLRNVRHFIEGTAVIRIAVSVLQKHNSGYLHMNWYKIFSSRLIFMIKSTRDMHICGCWILITRTFTLNSFEFFNMNVPPTTSRKYFKICVLIHRGLLILSLHPETNFFLQIRTLGGGFSLWHFLLVLVFVNPLNTTRRLLYLKTQFVPRSKHFSSRL